MNYKEQQIIRTSDGSNTLKSRFLNEHYHSTHGALTEAMHVYIKSGLKQIDKPTVSIFEMGFGTGLNAFLTFCNSSFKIKYETIDSEPISLELANQLDFLKKLDKSEYQSVFEELHSCEWGVEVPISNNFLFTKSKTTIQDKLFSKKYDIVYYDAFGPRVQPELWKSEIFLKIYNALNLGGLLITYCANGQFKRDLVSIGFEVKSIPGPPGKREITQAFRKK